jgi:diaminopimelate decarboxylase
MDAGAYGFSMASRYNQQPLPAEVVVEGDRWRVATRRETYAEMAEREAE